jgi:hypothetical protein
MKIELKNFKHYEKLSEETYCFTANVYVNGKFCGTAENRGIGGCTDCRPEHTEESRKLIAEAEQYCLTLPPNKWEHNGKEYSYKMNLEYYIEDLAGKMIQDKHKQKDAQKMRKKMQNAILIGNDDEYRTIGFKIPLKEVMEKHTDYFKKVLKEKLDKYAKDNYRLLNTNIPQQFLN